MSQTHASGDHAVRAGSGSFRTYTLGFVLSLVLTIIPFALVMTGALPPGATLWCLYAAAVIQIVVHLHYFLHLDRSSGMYWNMLSLLFTFFIMVLFIGGSLWIMYSLHSRM